MISRTTERFRAAFRQLPPDIQRRARLAYKAFERDPHHPSLQFKRVHTSLPVFSVRVALGYRAVGMRTGTELLWFWIGSHAEYDRVISQIRRG